MERRRSHEREPIKLSLVEAFSLSLRQTRTVIKETALGLAQLFSRELPLDAVGGPITIFRVASYAAAKGIHKYLEILAIISINLGLINLLPVPILDGGHLMLCLAEAVKRKPLSLRAREAANFVGLAFILALLALALRNDIMSLGIF